MADPIGWRTPPPFRSATSATRPGSPGVHVAAITFCRPVVRPAPSRLSRTDVSYLPDLRAHLDDLLRNRERVLAAADLDDWARAEALPSEEEITRIRHLISKITGDLGNLPPAERASIDDAVNAVRRHRTAMLGMPRIRAGITEARP